MQNDTAQLDLEKNESQYNAYQENAKSHLNSLVSWLAVPTPDMLRCKHALNKTQIFVQAIV